MTQRRLIRILVYEGTDEQLQFVMLQRALKGSKRFNGMLIREAIVGDFLEAFDHVQLEPDEQEQEQEHEGIRDLTPEEHRDSGQSYCPKCLTFGHVHSKTCPYRAHGILHHVTRT